MTKPCDGTVSACQSKGGRVRNDEEKGRMTKCSEAGECSSQCGGLKGDTEASRGKTWL